MPRITVAIARPRKRALIWWGLTLCLGVGACHKSIQIEKPPEAPARETIATEPEEATPTSAQPAFASLDAYLFDCAGKRIDLKNPINEIAAQMEADSLWYNKEPLSDCSGIFHRVLMAMQQRCPEYDFPAPETYRDTRDLARWYHERGDLILIQEALQSADLIKPGAVMFYGHRNKIYTQFAIDDVLSRTGIEHMGVVVSVDKDAAGQVVSYQLFHGQTYGKIASRTNFHLRKPTRPGLPPFGNWNQQWIAFARLLSPREN